MTANPNNNSNPTVLSYVKFLERENAHLKERVEILQRLNNSYAKEFANLTDLFTDTDNINQD